MSCERPICGAGLALRHEFIEEFAEATPAGVDFVEVTAEHYFHGAGLKAQLLHAVREQVPAVCHSLNANFGGSRPLDEQYLLAIRRFLDRHRIEVFSDHLCHSGDEDWMHNLMPIPFTDEAVRHTAGRIRRAQEILERTIAIENISYLTAPGRLMCEEEFIAAVLEEADCMLMLDVNNLYINSINMGYDAEAFLATLPQGRIAYAHMAGHLRVVDSAGGGVGDEEDSVVYQDTHGHPVSDPVLRLLEGAYRRFGVFPAVVERDRNIPPLPELLAEVEAIREIQRRQARPASPPGLPDRRLIPGSARVSVMIPESFSDIQRQFTRYLRDPDNAPLPAGADRQRMKFYARSYRAKLGYLLEMRHPRLVEALGGDALPSLLDDYVRLPRQSLGGKSTFEEAFVQYLEEESAGRELPPCIPELAHFSMQTALILNSARKIEDDGIDPDGDLLGCTPVWSAVAELLVYEWPVHRIGADFLPEARPRQPTRLIVYRDRRNRGGYIELNEQAADIAVRVRDNAIGRTGEEILREIGNDNLRLDWCTPMQQGLEILEALRRRDIVIGVRKE